jgi:hypothetical protein
MAIEFDARLAAERLRALGYPVVAVEALGAGGETIGVVRLPLDRLGRMDAGDRETIARVVRAFGFRHAAFDLDGPAV